MFNKIKSWGIKHKIFSTILIIISIFFILVVATSGYLYTQTKSYPPENMLYKIIYHEEDQVLLDDEISIREGETYEQSVTLEPNVGSVEISIQYNEDRQFSPTDKIELNIIPPENTYNLSEDFLHQEFEHDNFDYSHFAPISNYAEFTLINASSGEKALDFFYEHVDLECGSGEWTIQINYIGDGSLNLDRGGDLRISFTYTQFFNFKAIRFE